MPKVQCDIMHALWLYEYIVRDYVYTASNITVNWLLKIYLHIHFKKTMKSDLKDLVFEENRDVRFG